MLPILRRISWMVKENSYQAWTNLIFGPYEWYSMYMLSAWDRLGYNVIDMMYYGIYDTNAI